MRRVRYQEIADELRRDVEAAGPGSLLPSEAELSARFAVSRVTVRRALDVLRDDGAIDSRRGFGWFVVADPVRQHLNEFGTIEGQLAATGRVPERRITEFAFTAAPARVRDLLGTPQVLRVKRLNLADGEPFAVVTVWCPATLGQALSRSDVERAPFYELIGVELRGATQTIGAAAAEPGDAELLRLPAGAPVLRCERITTDVDNHVVLVSEHVFPAHRTEFVVDLPAAAPSISPAGLRLLD